MTWRARAFRIFLLGLALLTQAAWAGELVLRVSEGWEATRIVSDAPQTALLEFGEQFALPSGELVFWGRIRDGRDGWALLSLQAGRLRTILQEGEKSTSRYGEPGVQLHLHYQAEGLFHRATRIFAGKVLVLSTEQKISYGGSVYVWDGERLRGLLVEGERTTLGGVGVISGGFAWGANADGQVLLTLRTKKPDPYSAWALYDGSLPRLVARSGQALPGLPDTRVIDLCAGGSGMTCRVWLFDGGQILADLALLEGNAEEQAILLLSPAGSERLLGRGDPLPGDPTRTIDMASVETAESPRTFVARLAPPDPNWKGGARETISVRCDPAGCRPVSKEGEETPAAGGLPVPWPSASSLRWRQQWRDDGDTRIGRRDLEAVTSAGIIQLTPSGLLLGDAVGIRLVDGEIPGAIVEGDYWEGAANKYGIVDTEKLSVKMRHERWFVAADDLASGLQSIPLLRTLDGKSVSLADVLVRKGTGQVIARLGDGLYRLEKAAVPAAP